MEKFVITGGKPLHGTVRVSGAKNAALKTLVAACLTDETVTIHNFPLISDLHIMKDIIEILKGKITIHDHTIIINMKNISCERIPLDKAARIRTSMMFIAPLLTRVGHATVPNPGGDRIGSRPIDRIIKGLEQMGVHITYSTEDGYFYANTKGLSGTTYTFEKNTHTGTETLIMAAVLADGKTVLKNAAEEPEVDELIDLLTHMGAKVSRTAKREITIEGVKKLHGATINILPDRNEIVTFAIAAVITKGEVIITDAGKVDLETFLEVFKKAGGGYEKMGDDIRFFYAGPLHAVDITTAIHPGFMTDWQAPWAVYMTQATGISHIHETVFEYRFGYVKELQKMGAHITPVYDMVIEDPEKTYNFNLHDKKPDYFQMIKVEGPTQLHNAILTIGDLRAGATLVLAALAAKGTSTIFGIDQVDRGYEAFSKRLAQLGAQIERIQE